MNNIADTIRQIAQGGRQTVSLICTVDAVNKETRTVDCTPLDEGAPLLGVNLQANQESKFGIVVYPRVGSYIVVGFVADGSAGIVLMTDDIESIEIVVSDKTSRVVIDEDGVRVDVEEEISAEFQGDGIVLNGGRFGGLVKVEALTSKLNELIDAYNSHTHTLPVGSVGVTGSASAQTNPSPIVVPSVSTPHGHVVRSDYENESVKH